MYECFGQLIKCLKGYLVSQKKKILITHPNESHTFFPARCQFHFGFGHQNYALKLCSAAKIGLFKKKKK